MMAKVTERLSCRACGKKFSGKILLNFGPQAIVDFLDEGEVGRGKAPLQLVYCEGCGLVQLKHTVDADTLYRKFWYRSSVNEQMRDALANVVDSAINRAHLVAGDAVCDIGSNDGELLMNYPSKGIFKVGFEPAVDLAEESAGRFRVRQDENFEILPKYFNAVEALSTSKRVRYKIITAIAMFYDLDHPLDFLRDVKACLSPGGVFILQMNYLGLMVKNLAFDNISHEHLCYYSLSTLKPMLEKVGLGIFDVSLNDVNSGSIRIYAAHKNEALAVEEPSMQELLATESSQLSEQSIVNFAERVDGMTKVLLSFLKELKRAGKKVYAYGASTRGMTLLQSLFKEERASDYLIAAAERDPRKYGKRMAGLDIPIIPEEQARMYAEYFLLCPYHFWKSIREREKFWMTCGGKFIIPLPYPKVISCMGEDSMGLIPTARDLAEELDAIRA